MSFVNWPITVSILILLSTSILVIWSSSPELALQQGIFALFGLVFYFLVSKFDYRSLNNLIKPFYFLQLILLIIVLILGVETRGVIRWIPIGGINIQPSEFSKPILILFLAFFWSKNLPTWRNILISFLWISPPLLLIFKQPDLGTTLIIISIYLGLLFASGVSLKKLLILGLAVLLAVPIFWVSLHGYQKQRLSSFLSPTQDPLGTGYNLIQSTIAVGSGQLLGRGLGQGTQSRLQFLPEYRTDFIFASISEELGFLGSGLILAVYIFLVSYFLKVALRSIDVLGFLLALGAVSLLIFQTIVNIGMTIGLLPVTGITLPLISYGGSSLVATLITLGLVASVSRFKRFDIRSIGE